VYSFHRKGSIRPPAVYSPFFGAIGRIKPLATNGDDSQILTPYSRTEVHSSPTGVVTVKFYRNFFKYVVHLADGPNKKSPGFNMAKILMTAIVADIRNKLNGSVFSKNRYGAYVRTKVTPVNPQTVSQQNVRNRLGTNASAWRGLTESQRQAWIAAAAAFPITDIYGNSKILSGSALYVKLNNNLAVTGTAPISDAPSPVAIPALVLGAFTAVGPDTSMSLAFTPTPVDTDFELVIQATPAVGPGISFVKNQYRQITSLAAAATSPANLLTAYQAVHGDFATGNKVFVRAFLVSTVTGQAGIPVSAMAIVS
jgi:hypothetical protein